MNRTLTTTLVLFPAVAVLAALVLDVSAGRWQTGIADMQSYVHAGELLRAGGTGVYAPAGLPEGVWPFLYPPAFAAVFAGLLGLAGDGAFRLWGVVVGASIVLSFLALARWSRLDRTRATLLVAALALPSIQLVLMGQVDALVVALLAFALLADRSERPLLCGGLIAAAALIKVIPILALLPFVLLRRWRVVQGAALALVVGVLLPLPWLVAEGGLAHGVARLAGLHVEFLDRVVLRGVGQDTDPGWMLLPTNASLSGTALRLFGAPILGTGAMMLLLAGGVWATARSREAALGIGLIVAAAALGNFVFWPHNAFLFALPLALGLSLPTAVLYIATYLVASWIHPVIGTVGYLAVWLVCARDGLRPSRLGEGASLSPDPRQTAVGGITA